MKTLLKIFLGLVVLVFLLVGGFLAYASATHEKRMHLPETPFPKVEAAKDPEAIERGKYLVYGPAHCAQCHSVDDRKKPELVVPGVPLSGGLLFEIGPLATFRSANLTPDPETGIGKRTDAELARAIRTGILHDGFFSFMMRFSAAHLSDEDLAAVIAFLRSQPPVKKPIAPPEVSLMGKAMLTLMPIKAAPVEGAKYVPAAAEPSVERGKYLAESVALCVGCHTTYDMSTFEPVGPKAGGGNVDASHGDDKEMEFAPPNLTSHPMAGYTGRTDEESFLARLKSGRAIVSSIMPWENFKTMTDSDMRSIYRYLKSLPPVDKDLGPSYRKQGTWKPN